MEKEMSKIMKTTSLTSLLERIAGEYRAKDSIFEIPAAVFKNVFSMEAESTGMQVMSGKASIPIGPAAGPHTQIAPNIVAAYLAGSRVFELKTVQENDHLDIEKPCIDALDEGHNVEWSTELTLDEARMEYLNAWIAVNLLAALFSKKPQDFFFNMSVGYTLAGIQGKKVDSFIEGMRRPEATEYWEKAIAELQAFVAGETFTEAFGEANLEKARTLAAHMPVRPVHSVTLSTMHGCPPDEIEKIGRYLIEEKGFDTYIKLNPTLLGFDEARKILDQLGWTEISLKRESFEHDLQFEQAINLIQTLTAVAREHSCRFGIKLSNTLANANVDERLPGAERYMSGRALFPITVSLAAKLAKALPNFDSRFSYCGGVSALNAADLIKAGMGPLTVATDILKPGGYLRLSQIASEVTGSVPFAPDRVDPEALTQLSQAVLARPEYRKEWKNGTVSIRKPLPLFDCFAAPCIEACPVNQKAPAYIKAQGEGKSEQALATILSDNPLAHTTGVLCDHVCQEHCSRLDYEGAVRIRDVKLTSARTSSIPPAKLPEQAVKPAGKTAVIGAGPAGLACAYHLALSGYPVTVFDADNALGGVPTNIIPSFRISREELKADLDRIQALGVEFVPGTSIDSLKKLSEKGYTSFFLGIGAHKARELPLKGSGVRVINALEFLAECSKQGTQAFAGIQHVVVAGGGNTACDAVRAATRIPGIASVRLSYRRTKKEMPADLEELENALREASAVNLAGAESSAVLHELSLPESAQPGKLTLRVMKLGEKDSSGRRSPVPTEETFEVPCDLVIAAVGEEPDRAFFEKLGIECRKNSLPTVNPATLETSAANIYAGGDARRGPASIIAAEADGRKAAYAILAKEGFRTPEPDYTAPALDKNKLARRGELLPSLPFDHPDFAKREAERCLACDSACLRCVEVCPNRANIYIEMGQPFTQDAQIVHVDKLCNECGNCGFFCPYDGEPFSGKPTLFDTIEDMEHSRNAGFCFIFSQKLPALAVRSEIGGMISRFDYASWNGAVSLPGASNMIALAREIYRKHSYLLEHAL